MGDASTPLTQGEARHLLRRTGFGALPDEVENIVGFARGVAVDDLLDFVPQSFKLQGDDIPALHNSWVWYLVRPRRIRRAAGQTDYLARSRHALQEKLVLFWHDHFACDATVVGLPSAIVQQNLLLRRFCKANFRDFVKAINTNPMMMAFLDTIRNRKAEPNENYARELMELFTLGVTDFAGNANYLQEDIVQIARAFTGWFVDAATLTAFLLDGAQCTAGYHDYAACFPARGPKVIFQSTGGFGPAGRSFAVNGEGEPEIGTVIDIIFEHRDTDGKNTVARYIAHKLLTYFAHATPAPSVVDEVVSASGFDVAFELQPLLRAIFVHDAFYATAAPAASGAPKSVKWPIDYVASTLRLLRMEMKDRRHQHVRGASRYIRQSLTDMGQTLLQPPSVFGWDWEEAWLASSRLLARFAFATDVISARGGGRTGLHAVRLIDLRLTDPGDIVDAVTDRLNVKDQLTAAERQVLIDYLGGPLDLHDRDVRNVKLHGLIGMVLVSPAYQLH